MRKNDSKISSVKRALIIHKVKDLKWAILIGLIFSGISIGFIPISSEIVTGVVVDSGYKNTDEGNVVFIVAKLQQGYRVKVNIPRKGVIKMGKKVRLFENKSLYFSKKTYKFISYENWIL